MIAYLKKEDAEKDTQVDQLKHHVKTLQVESNEDKEMLTEEYSQQIALLEANMSEKDEEVGKEGGGEEREGGKGRKEGGREEGREGGGRRERYVSRPDYVSSPSRSR